MRRSRRIIVVAVATAIVLAAVIVFVILPNRDPDAHHQAAGVATSCGTLIAATGMTIYHIIAGQTTASYTAHEDQVGVNPNHIVIGKTHAVTGTFLAQAGAAPLVTGADIAVDLNSLRSDDAMRDEDLANGYLDTYQYPKAEFISTCAQDLPAMYSDGQSVIFHLSGNLIMHGKTNAEDFAVQGHANGKTVTGTATATIYLTDFGITPPNVLNVTVVQNKVVLTIDFTAQAT